MLVYRYRISVVTGEKFDAGTEANVYVMIVGLRGDTGQRMLTHCISSNERKFAAGNVCILFNLTFCMLYVSVIIELIVLLSINACFTGAAWHLCQCISTGVMTDVKLTQSFLLIWSWMLSSPNTKGV